MKARGQEVNPVSGAALDKLVAELYATPKDVVAETKKAIGGSTRAASPLCLGLRRASAGGAVRGHFVSRNGDLRRVGRPRATCAGFISSAHGAARP